VRDLEREREDPDDESEWDPEDEESESDPESQSVSEPEDVDALLLLFPDFVSVCGSPGVSFARSFSLASSNLLAVPVFVLNSSGNSTEGCPSSLSLSNALTFASCCVLDGRETYGRVDLHSKMKCPVPKHFWQTVVVVAPGLFPDRL